MNKQIPKYSEWLIKIIVPLEIQDYIIGDYEDLYHQKQKESGKRAAMFWLLFHLIINIPGFIKTSIHGGIIMFNNYFKISLRSAKKNKVFSVLNILGLSLGLASAIIVMLYLFDQTSYDRFFNNYENIYRVGLNVNDGERETKYAFIPPPVAPFLKDNYNEVEHTSRVFYFHGTRSIKYKDKLFYEDGFVYVDKSLFSILNFEFLEGTPEQALKNPNSVILPERLAKKYFGNESPVGKTVLINNQNHKVTAVIKSLQNNSHFEFDLFLSMQDLRNPPWMTDWSWPGMYTYVKLKNGVSADNFENKISSIGDSHISKKSELNSKNYKYFLQPLKDIYLYSDLEYDMGSFGNSQYLFIFSAAGLFILILACVNYINMSTAKAVKRSREVGLRKVIGANRSQLVYQFLGESLVYVFVSFALVLGVIYLIIPEVNLLIGSSIKFSTLFKPELLLGLITILICTSIATGAYPAFILSSYKPSKVLSGNYKNSKEGVLLRKSFVIGQFVLSLLLIIGSLLMHKQISYMQTKELGFVKELKIILPIRERQLISDNYKEVRSELLRNKNIKNVSFASQMPGEGAGSLNTKLIGAENNSYMMYYKFIDDQFLPSFNIKFLSGRNFDLKQTTDLIEACIINSEAAKMFGYSDPQEIIGKTIISGFGNKKRMIIGVVDNFHFRSVHYKVEPLILEMNPDLFMRIAITVDAKNSKLLLSEIENYWNQKFVNVPFSSFYLDNFINNLYTYEANSNKLINILTILAIVIAIIGIFGLVTYLLEQQKKEISIRKVLGASNQSIVNNYIIDFLKWIIIALIISIPLIYFVFEQWIQSFAYKVDFDPIVIVFGGASLILIVLITILYQVVKASLANPVDALKYD